jgi:1,2-phenylacetyl-CoA epoxidase catalytic subunit
MEPHRQEAQQRSQAAEDPATKDQIRREFIRTATEIITRHGMTVPEYNRITLWIRSEEGKELKQRIEAEILRLQSRDSHRKP